MEISVIRENKKELEDRIKTIINDFARTNEVAVLSIETEWIDGKGVEHKPQLVKLKIGIDI